MRHIRTFANKFAKVASRAKAEVPLIPANAAALSGPVRSRQIPREAL